MPQPASCAIEPHYHEVRILHKNIERTRHVIALFPGQAPVTERQLGSIYIDPELPDENNKHVALGRFMDTWSKLELQLRSHVEELLFTAHPPTARTVSGTLSQRSLSDMLLNLVSMHLPSKDLATYTKLTERFAKLNTMRNYLVHGSWVIELIVGYSNGKPDVQASEVRQYPPADNESREALDSLRNVKVRGKYLLSLPQIAHAEQDAAKLYNDFSQFHRARKALRRSVFAA